MRSAIFSLVAMAASVSAHAQVYGLWVDGKDQGDGRGSYIRSPANNSPVKDLASPALICNVNGAKPVSDFVSVKAGSEITFEWYHDNRGDDIIDGSHQGPIITYIAEYSDSAAGAIWTKIDESGFDGSKWAVDKLIANGGKYDFTLPASLASGKYILRQEIIAHHESDAAFNQNPARGAQFYPSCAQIEVTGTGSAVPDQAFDFNTGYTYADPGIVFNIYSSYTSYQIPGPEVWTGAGGSSPAPSKPAESSAAATSAVASPTEAPVSEGPAFTESASPTTLVTVTKPAESTVAQVTATEEPAPTATPTRRPCSGRKGRKTRRAN
ncbi:related to endoglucanase B [Cephalotrichum gorgonifer]|uniref:lytic cellulose monooxygenase (C4-dehydrogenating) n=1 Tax=Cephalotrichum gorgonifer TaxID=2041049 RepID=A0AAE8SWA5_9PEZI|nr:related to endoglucanase B [Cephalotrichum gorgonifer]